MPAMLGQSRRSAIVPGLLVGVCPSIHNGPVSHGAPTHAPLIEVTTPLEFRTSAAIVFPVVGWTRKGR